MPDPEVEILLAAVPEFVDRFVDLVEAADGDPGAAAAFEELADFIATLITEGGPRPPVLTRCLDAVEQVALESEDAEELIAWSFLDSLCLDDLNALEPWLGRQTRVLAVRHKLACDGETPRGTAMLDRRKAANRAQR